MTDTNLPLRCQVGDCRNRAALTVTVELPSDWSDSRQYNVVTLQVAVCGDCAPDLEDRGSALQPPRVRYARRLEIEANAARLATELVALIEAVGPPFEPVHGGTFATWLAKLDKPLAQAAWRLLAHVKRQTTGGRQHCGGRLESGHQAERGACDRAPAQPLSIEDAHLRRRALVPPIEPPPGPRTPTAPSPEGGDDAA